MVRMVAELHVLLPHFYETRYTQLKLRSQVLQKEL